MCAVYVVEQNVKASSCLPQTQEKPHSKILREPVVNNFSGFWRNACTTLFMTLQLKEMHILYYTNVLGFFSFRCNNVLYIRGVEEEEEDGEMRE